MGITSMNSCGAKLSRPWKAVDELELATLGWVDWLSQDNLHGFIGDVPPAEFEETVYVEQRQAKVPTENTTLAYP
jgi:transposase InsO family protein